MDKMDEFRNKIHDLFKEYGADLTIEDDYGEPVMEVWIQKHFDEGYVSIGEQWVFVDDEELRVNKRFK